MKGKKHGLAETDMGGEVVLRETGGGFPQVMDSHFRVFLLWVIGVDQVDFIFLFVFYLAFVLNGLVQSRTRKKN